MAKKLFLFALVFTFFLGCKSTRIDPPAYLEIDGYKTITDSTSIVFSPEGQGTSIQKFTDVLIESSTNNYGYYPMPGKTPLPLSGATYLSIRPVIEVNGVKALRVDYPLMKGYDTTISLALGKITKVTPIFKYFNGVVFRYMENFSSGSSVNPFVTSSDNFCVKTNYILPFPYDGDNHCLFMQLDGDSVSHEICQTQTNTAFILPGNATNVFLEFNYKCNTSFELGLITAYNSNSPTGESPRTAGGANSSGMAWNKLYVNLTPLVSSPPIYTTPSYFYLYFGTTWDGQARDSIFIDNIKIISQN